MVVLHGNLAPRGAVIKQSAASPKLLQHTGRAVVFESVEDMTLRVDDPDLDVTADDVLVLRNAGPKGAPGMPEAGYLPIPKKLARGGTKDMVRISDARMSGTAFGTIVLHITPESAVGGPLALVKHYRFAYDQPRNTGYSIAGDLFADKLKELSKGTMIIDQYPGAQLGQEPQVLQLVKAGDVEFAIISSANTATISPQAGVMSLHFLFRAEAHVVKGLADPKVFEALKTMIDETTQGLHVIATGSQGVRHMYSKKEIRSVGDAK